MIIDWLFDLVKERGNPWMNFWFLSKIHLVRNIWSTGQLKTTKSINQSINPPLTCLTPIVNVHMDGECRLIDGLAGDITSWILTFPTGTYFRSTQDVERNVSTPTFQNCMAGQAQDYLICPSIGCSIDWLMARFLHTVLKNQSFICFCCCSYQPMDSTDADYSFFFQFL